MAPANNMFSDITPLLSGCNRPLKMSFEDQLNILVYFHLEGHHSGRHLLQVLKEEDFARQYIAPVGGIEKSSFFEDISSRGLEQMMEMFGKLYTKAAKHLPREHGELGDLVLIDGSLLKVYHLISRSKYGLMVQMLAGLITYILLAIYCHDQHNEIVSVNRLRELCIDIRNDMSLYDIINKTGVWFYKTPNQDPLNANP